MTTINYLLLFLVQFVQPVTFRVVGELNLGECLLPFLLLVNFRRTLRVARIPLVKAVLVLGLLYFLALVLSDLYRGTLPEDYLRGWARVGVCLLSTFIYLGALWQRPRALVATICGSVASVVPLVLLQPVPADVNYAYKWFFGAPLVVLTVLAAGKLIRKHPMVSVLLVGGVGALSLRLDYRSLGGAVLLTMLVLTVGYYVTSRQLTWGARKATIVAVTLLLAGWAVLMTYGFLAPRGSLGEEARAKYERQAEEDSFSLLSGRSELYYSLPKIKDSPIIGWGSWAKDLDYVLDVHARRFPNKSVSELYATQGRIPAHSYVFGSWLEAGVFGGVFWIAVLWIVGRNLAFTRMPVAHRGIWAVFVLSTVIMAWDLLFSPLGAAARVDSGFYIAWQCVAASQMGFSRLRQIRPNVSIPRRSLELSSDDQLPHPSFSVRKHRATAYRRRGAD